ncbi:hypothetical protein EZS27_009725, partial [termite gut metagenome]
NYGIKTGYNEAFIIDGKTKDELIAKSSKNAEIIRPILRGRDIKRYGYEFADLWLICTFPSRKIDIEEYPDIKNHLLSFGYDRLKQTGEKGARKKTNNKWFETQDSIGYWDDFYKHKIMWKIIGCNLNFFYDTNGFYCNNAVNIMVGRKNNLLQFIGLMNSKLFDWYLKLTTTAEVQGGGIQMYSTTLEILPIKLDFDDNFTFNVLSRIDNNISDSDLNNIVYNLYKLSNEEINFIESQ